MTVQSNRSRLIAILRLAYSGELAAAYAYRGHHRSVSTLDEKKRIEEIENDEWRHRNHVGEMLRNLNAKPGALREVRAAMIGRTLGMMCHVAGWLVPMYGAGKLESRNIREYEAAARFARGAGRMDFVECLLSMAEVEWDHERYFRLKVLSHRWGTRLPIWPLPPPRERIRELFAEEDAKIKLQRQSPALEPTNLRG